MNKNRIKDHPVVVKAAAHTRQGSHADDPRKPSVSRSIHSKNSNAAPPKNTSAPTRTGGGRQYGGGENSDHIRHSIVNYPEPGAKRSLPKVQKNHDNETSTTALNVKNIKSGMAHKSRRDHHPNVKTYRGHQAKVRLPLPPVETYQKQLEFPVSANGRVTVRLERLMGTDRVRITDPRFMNALLRALEEEEYEIWLHRLRNRVKNERERYRQLAIDGIMEPDADMQDLYSHPVFRVNRILARLMKFDRSMTLTPSQKMPLITPVEPFEEQERTGLLFGFHPEHYKRVAKPHPQLYKRDAKSFTTVIPENMSIDRLEFPAQYKAPSLFALDGALARLEPGDIEDGANYLFRYKEWGGESGYQSSEEEDGEEDDGGEDENGIKGYDPTDTEGLFDLLKTYSLGTVQEQMGIPRTENLEHDWGKHRSPLVDLVYDDEQGTTNTIFKIAKEVMTTYKREQLKADATVTKFHRL